MKIPTQRMTALLAAAALVVALALTGVYFGYANPLGDSPVKESVKGGPDPDTEPEYYPDPTVSGPSATPRPCPECFAKPLPKPSPGQPCPQRPLVSASDVNFLELSNASTQGWIEYRSPNYPFRFLYPPDWKLEASYNEVYAERDATGVLTGGRISGPVTESLKLYNAPAASSGITEGAFPPGSGIIDIVYGPDIGSEACSPNSTGNPRRLELEIASLPAVGTQSIVEPPTSEILLYFVSATAQVGNRYLVISGYSYGDSLNLAVMRTLAGTAEVAP